MQRERRKHESPESDQPSNSLRWGSAPAVILLLHSQLGQNPRTHIRYYSLTSQTVF